MKKPIPFPRHPSADPVSLAAAAVHSLIQLLPSGTAFFIGVVLIVMMTGRLVHHKGGLARAVLPFVVHLLGLAPGRASDGAGQDVARCPV
jgi:hypothetical protein